MTSRASSTNKKARPSAIKGKRSTTSRGGAKSTKSTSRGIKNTAGRTSVLSGRSRAGGARSSGGNLPPSLRALELDLGTLNFSITSGTVLDKKSLTRVTLKDIEGVASEGAYADEGVSRRELKRRGNFWIKAQNGEIQPVKFSRSWAVKPGHRVSLLSIMGEKQKFGYFSKLYNHTTGKVYNLRSTAQIVRDAKITGGSSLLWFAWGLMAIAGVWQAHELTNIPAELAPAPLNAAVFISLAVMLVSMWLIPVRFMSLAAITPMASTLLVPVLNYIMEGLGGSSVTSSITNYLSAIPNAIGFEALLIPAGYTFYLIRSHLHLSHAKAEIKDQLLDIEEAIL